MKEDDLNTWEVPLNLAYITYAAKDAYACYDMYLRILDMRACLLPVTDEYTDSQAIPLLPHIVRRRQLHRPTLHPNKSTLVLPLSLIHI